MLFTVAGRRGKLITNLKRDDFSVFEDDRLQNISNFSAETDLPLNIAFLIDTSGSIWGKLRFEREAAARFFYSALRPGKDKASILTFDSEMTLRQNYTDDPAILTASMQRLISGGSTALYQAVSEAVTERLAGQTGRRVVIVVSDGVDNSSHISLERTLEVAQKNDVVIYAVSTNGIDGPVFQKHENGDANLKRLAEETGGRAMFPTKVDELTHSFYRISDELRAQYSLAYGPTNARRDGTFRQIRIVAAHKDYEIRSRNGYFAPGPDDVQSVAIRGQTSKSPQFEEQLR